MLTCHLAPVADSLHRRIVSGDRHMAATDPTEIRPERAREGLPAPIRAAHRGRLDRLAPLLPNKTETPAGLRPTSPARLENDHPPPGLSKPQCGEEAREATPDDHDVDSAGQLGTVGSTQRDRECGDRLRALHGNPFRTHFSVLHVVL
ncbi:hypothetical protein GCM10011490_21730 [Pseudoclavibacter endophyticus]|nr:hypothetical protein GCM10011490_21730 [Pseudoclavibacter endophyticus]